MGSGLRGGGYTDRLEPSRLGRSMLRPYKRIKRRARMGA